VKSPSPRSAQHDAASSHPPRERRRGLLRRRRRLRLARRRHHLPLRRHHLPLRRRLGPLAVARKARLRAVSRTRLGRASHAPRGRGFAVARRARLRVGVVTHAFAVLSHAVLAAALRPGGGELRLVLRLVLHLAPPQLLEEAHLLTPRR